MIIFDCDGVLLDSEVIADRILCESLSELINKKENHHEMSDPSFVQQWLVDLCGQTDEEILEIDAQIEDEIKKGILPDPNVPTDENGNPIEDPNMMGATPMDMDIDASSTEVTDPVDLEGGAI